MALPVTITGIATSPACVGPFKSSGGNYYFFGKDSSAATTLQAFKATDPSSSWASIATNTGFSTAVQSIAGYQDGDVIHLAVMDGATTSVNLKYRTFDMSSDSFVTSETVHSGFDPQTSAGLNRFECSIVFRSSDSQPIILYNGPNVASMGSKYARTVYARRTGAATWTTNQAVDSGGTIDWISPEAVVGASSRIQFFWIGNAAALNLRALTSANALQTASTAGTATSGNPPQAVSYDSSGTQKVVAGKIDSGGVKAAYFDDGDTPTASVSAQVGTLDDTARAFIDATTAWILAREGADTDLYVASSTDHGATWSATTKAFTGAVNAGYASLSIDGAIYQRGSDVVIPYVVNDNGTLKYNEYVVRTVSSNKTLAADGGSYALTGTAATPKLGRKVAANSGSYALTGTDATFRKGLKLAADAGSYAITGTAATTRKTWRLDAGAGSYALTGTAAAPKHGWRVAAEAGSYAITGTDVTLRRTYRLAADPGSYAITGTDATAKHGWRVAADAGSYSITGSDATATIASNKTLTADAGSYAISGTAATALHTWKVAAEAGSYSITGTDANIYHAWKVVPEAGDYAITGTAATPLHAWRVSVDAGSYALTGTDATPIKSGGNKVTAADAGSYAITGTDASFVHVWKVAADAGAYAITGTAASLRHAWKITAEAGSYSVTGTDAGTVHRFKITADAGAYALTGTDASLRHTWRLAADSGSYSVNGSDATITKLAANVIVAELGTYTITGSDAIIQKVSNQRPEVWWPVTRRQRDRDREADQAKEDEALAKLVAQLERAVEKKPSRKALAAIKRRVEDLREAQADREWQSFMDSLRPQLDEDGEIRIALQIARQMQEAREFISRDEDAVIALLLSY